jgi:hypothetical protein
MRQSRKLFRGYPPLRGFESLPLRQNDRQRGPGTLARGAGTTCVSGTIGDILVTNMSPHHNTGAAPGTPLTREDVLSPN